MSGTAWHGARALVAEMERHQVVLYLVALAGGVGLGLTLPGIRGAAAAAVPFALVLLLYVTFLAVPIAGVGRALRDWRFLATVLVVNFAVVPAVVWPLSRVLAHDNPVFVGALFVLLAPCVDYVIVFTGLAGGSGNRLLAATPLLLAAQLLMLPVFLWWFGAATTDDTGAPLAGVDAAVFVRAFLLYIVLPLVAAVLTQLAARSAPGAAAQRVAEGTMVPLMMLTLAAVVASQIAAVVREISGLTLAMLVFLAFAAAMVPLGMLAARVAQLDTAGSRAVVLSGVTRNSLVVLPLVLALPREYEIATAVVVSQTVVELFVMVALVQLVPRLIPERDAQC